MKLRWQPGKAKGWCGVWLPLKGGWGQVDLREYKRAYLQFKFEGKGFDRVRIALQDKAKRGITYRFRDGIFDAKTGIFKLPLGSAYGMPDWERMVSILFYTDGLAKPAEIDFTVSLPMKIYLSNP